MIKGFSVTLALLALFFNVAQAQFDNPVKWSFNAKKTGDKIYELHIEANLDANWHIYAQDAGEGPEPTSFHFSVNPLVKLNGKVEEKGKLEKTYDPNFKSVLKYYSNHVEFIQKVKVKSSATTLVKGTLIYMVCNDKKCLPPKEIPFSIKLGGR